MQISVNYRQKWFYDKLIYKKLQQLPFLVNKDCLDLESYCLDEPWSFKDKGFKNLFWIIGLENWIYSDLYLH